MTTKINASVVGYISSMTAAVITLTDSESTSPNVGTLYFGYQNVNKLTGGDGNNFSFNNGAGVINGYSFSGTATYATRIVLGGNVGGMANFTHNAAATAGTPTYMYGSSDGLTWNEYASSNFSAAYLGGLSKDTAANANTIAQRNGDADIYANYFRGTATAAQYGDVAERYLADKNYEPGTVVVFGGDKEITESKIVGDRRVAGVISTNPAHLMNEALTDGLPVALTGRVPCKVMGYVRKGDLMVTSHIPGVARADNEAKVGTVIGKALEDYQSTEVGVIEVVVGRV